MMEKIFDSHAHYDDEKFETDRREVLDGLFSDKVCGIINCGCDFKSSSASVELAKKYENIYAAVGVHPHEAEDVNDEEFAAILKLLDERKVVALGEIGLDFHYDFSPREKQIEMFERQVKIAKELDIPIIVHDREAHEETYKILRKYKPKGVVHCFSGSVELAKETIKLGMYIGLGGAVTFKNAVKPVEVAKLVPMERILLETDAPYMSPVPFRGKRCQSDMIEYTALKIAEIKGISYDTVVKTARNNTKELFNL
ncbi:MAG: TatD family deoxyribonuclease [Ruminococcaceae bacterium]|nr:TatD family deoxyribonuclease [Oscillospiraceae bacterium]